MLQSHKPASWTEVTPVAGSVLELDSPVEALA
jgi:hypothetical protein